MDIKSEKVGIEPHKLRLKITGKCNKSCVFCHEEGGMKNIEDFRCDDNFKNFINRTGRELNIKEIILTGGEPLLNKDFERISFYLKEKGFRVGVTTNGTIVKNWKDISIDKITISLHSLCPKKILEIERKKRTLEWATHSLENQIRNIKLLSEAGIETRVNMVVVNDDILGEIKKIKILQERYKFELRLLNNLNEVEKSREILEKLIKKLKARKKYRYRREKSSNYTVYYQSDIINFSVKTVYPFFFDYICSHCPLRDVCKEGFYGLRVEKRNGDYYIRLCLYRNDKEVLMPYEKFLNSELKNKYLELS